ncbi:hypothetical protein CT19431_MP30262 [Cupriavidus taiwanensis]|nr:hypothetical protein CT19431_MP30262 [Cupriavidus taiwanensis]
MQTRWTGGVGHAAAQGREGSAGVFALNMLDKALVRGRDAGRWAARGAVMRGRGWLPRGARGRAS